MSLIENLVKNIHYNSRDKLCEQAAAFPNDTSGARFFFLRSGEIQSVVHFPLFVKYRLLLFNFSDTLLLRLV